MNRTNIRHWICLYHAMQRAKMRAVFPPPATLGLGPHLQLGNVIRLLFKNLGSAL